jgi:hypothetical protein
VLEATQNIASVTHGRLAFQSVEKSGATGTSPTVNLWCGMPQKMKLGQNIFASEQC